MKKLLLLVIVLFVSFIVVACSDEIDETQAIQWPIRGIFDEYVYQNEYLGIQIDFSADWREMSDSPTQPSFSSYLPNRGEIINEEAWIQMGQWQISDFLMMTLDPLVASATVMIIYTNLEMCDDSLGLGDCNDLFDLQNFHKSILFSNEEAVEYDDVIIGDMTFARMAIYTDIDGIVLQRNYVTNREDHFMRTIQITVLADSSLAMMPDGGVTFNDIIEMVETLED